MHIHNMWRISQHVTVQCGSIDSFLSQCLKNQGNLITHESKIARDSAVSGSSWLKIDHSDNTHRRWEHYIAIGNSLRARNIVLINFQPTGAGNSAVTGDFALMGN